MKKAVKDPGKLRRTLNISQSDFWTRIGVTQSCGSRYETGGNIPDIVQVVIDLVYGTNKQALGKLAEMRGISLDELLTNGGK